MSKTCTRPGCERGCYGEFCLIHKPRKPLPAPTKRIITKKRPRQLGKQYDLWKEVRQQWITDNPAIDGYWRCALRISPDCMYLMDIDSLTIDHIKPRSNAANYSRRHDADNLQAACWACNNAKGSRHATV